MEISESKAVEYGITKWNGFGSCRVFVVFGRMSSSCRSKTLGVCDVVVYVAKGFKQAGRCQRVGRLCKVRALQPP